mmetsp:Transcript_12558/g.25225  ORF Transcript_12558/g.25225 Transcript_12558/m.25225 type:complete len:379 (+) Transcript_12558:1-1137(+)
MKTIRYPTIGTLRPSHRILCQAHVMSSILSSTTESSITSVGKTNAGNAKHLIVLVNGLWGRAKHWKTVENELQRVLDSSSTVVHASKVNQLFQTYAGIDVCGSALADEVKQVAQQDRYDKISFVGHSMGGLIARNAIGKLYHADDEELILGHLEPCHFVTLATPHVGFVPTYEDVPLVHWIRGTVPSALGEVVLDRGVPWLTSIMMGESGKQFFLRDGDVPILYSMALDPYISALKRFKTRTCYGNRSGDHLVGWCNSSLRSREEIEYIQQDIGREMNTACTGVVREDPLHYAWAHPEVTSSHSPSSDTSCAMHELQNRARENLKSVGWRRIDVCFKDSRLWFLSHQHIMVQRSAINMVGMETAKHIARQIHLYENTI